MARARMGGGWESQHRREAESEPNQAETHVEFSPFRPNLSEDVTLNIHLSFRLASIPPQEPDSHCGCQVCTRVSGEYSRGEERSR